MDRRLDLAQIQVQSLDRRPVDRRRVDISRDVGQTVQTVLGTAQVESGYLHLLLQKFTVDAAGANEAAKRFPDRSPVVGPSPTPDIGNRHLPKPARP